jgi:hypothetical protein
MHDIDEVGQPEVPAWVIIFGQWEREGYPDDIGGFYYDSAADSYGILIVDPSPQRIAELRELFGDDVIITPGRFSRNELMLVQNEITEIMSSNTDSGIYSSGIGWTRIDGTVRGFGESGKEFRVVVSVGESVFDHYNDGFASRYGERVYVEIGHDLTLFNEDDMVGGRLSGTDTTVTDSAGIIPVIVPIDITGVFSGGISSGNNNIINDSFWLWLIIGIVLLGTLVIFVWKRPRHSPAMQTANSGIVTGNTALTRKQVIAAVKNNEAIPGDKLFKSIMQQIDSHR